MGFLLTGRTSLFFVMVQYCRFHCRFIRVLGNWI